MFEMNDNWLLQAVCSNEAASVERPHVVLVDDVTLGSVTIHGPFASGLEACTEADAIAAALTDDGGALLPPVITVIALTSPPECLDETGGHVA